MEIQDLVRENIIGNIKIGTKGEKGPKKLPYFNVEKDKATSQEMVDIFKQLYKEKTTKLIIMFTSENPFSFRYKRYANNKLACMGNNKKAITIGKDDKGYNTRVEVVCDEKCEQRIKGKCKLEGSLKFILPGIEAGGVWKISTKGEWSITNIATEIFKYKKAGKSIVNTPFELNLIEQDSLGYGTYYSLQLHGEDIKPKLVTNTVPQLSQSTTQETKQLAEGTKKENEKKDKKETETAKLENKEKISHSTEIVNESSKVEETNKEIQESDFNANDVVLKGFMPTMINGKKFDKIIFQDINGQDVEYVLHPKANQEIISCDVGTIIEIKETKIEIGRNILCKYEMKQVVKKDENNNEELKKAV